MNACAPLFNASYIPALHHSGRSSKRHLYLLFLDKRYAVFPVKEAGLNAQSKTKQGGTCVNCSSDTFPESSSFIAEEE